MIEQLKGLKGLSAIKPLNEVPKEDKELFTLKNKNLLEGKDDEYANNLWINYNYLKIFGEEAFDLNTDFESRKAQLEEYVVNSEFDRRFKPRKDKNGNYDLSTGMGADYNTSASMSTQFKKELLESDYESPESINARHDARQKEIEKTQSNISTGASMSTLMSLLVGGSLTSTINEVSREDDLSDNQKILEEIRQRYLHEQEATYAKPFYLELLNQLSDLSSSEIDDLMEKETSTRNGLGNGWYQEYKNEDELKDFSTADKIDYLARKYSLQQAGFSGEEIYTLLNGDMQNLINENQGWWVDQGLKFKKRGITAADYLTQQLGRSEYQLATMAMSDAEIYVDANNPNKIIPKSQVDTSSNIGIDESGNQVPVKKVVMSASALFNEGRDRDGEELPFWLNSKYWERASKYNTLDSKEQERIEDGSGVSKYNAVYGVGEDTSIIDDVLDSSSYIAVDVGMTALGGSALKTLQVMNNSVKVGRALEAVGSVATKAHTVTSTLGMSGLEAQGAYQESLETNLKTLDKVNKARAIQEARDFKANNSQDFNKEVNAEINRLKQEQANKAKREGSQNFPLSDSTLKEMAENNVIQKHVADSYNKLINSQDYANAIAKARGEAAVSANIDFITEAVVNGFINDKIRDYAFKDHFGLTKSKLANKINSVVEKNGKLVFKDADKFTKRFNKFKQLGKEGLKQGIGEAYEEMMDDFNSNTAQGVGTSLFQNYLLDQYNGEAFNQVYGENSMQHINALEAYYKGAVGTLMDSQTYYDGLLGALGSLNSNPTRALNMATIFLSRKQYKKKLDEDLRAGLINESQYQEMVKNQPKYWDSNRSVLENLNNTILGVGVLDEYYANKEANKLFSEQLDRFNGWIDKSELSVLKDAFVSTNSENGTLSEIDSKDSQFLKALTIARTLKQNFNDSSEDSKLWKGILEKSSIGKETFSLIDALENDELTQEQTNNLLIKYFADNQNIPRTEENVQKALQIIKDNYHKIKKSSEALEEARTKIAEYEKDNGPLDDLTKNMFEITYALGVNSQERINKLESEINPNGASNSNIKSFFLSFGSLATNANQHIEALKSAKKDVIENIVEATKEIERNKKILEYLKNNPPSDTDLKITKSAHNKKVEEAEKALEAAKYIEEKNKNALEALVARETALTTDNPFSNKILEDGTEELGTEDLDVEDVFGFKIDLQDNRSIAQAIDFIKGMKWDDRARLIKTLEDDIAARADAKFTGNYHFGDKAFNILNSIYNRMKLSDPTLISKIKDVTTLTYRLRGLNEFNFKAMTDPRALSYLLDKEEDVELKHASALWLDQQSRLWGDLEAKTAKWLKLKSVPKTMRSKKYQSFYNTIFNRYIHFDKKLLEHMAKHPEQHPLAASIINNVIEYKDFLQDIVSSIQTLSPDISNEDINAFINDLHNNTDTLVPTRNDLVYALDKLKDRTYGTLNVSDVYSELAKLDEARNSTIIEDAKKINNRKSSKEARKKYLKERQEEVERQIQEREEVEKKKREEERRRQEGKPKEEAVEPGPQNGRPRNEVESVDETKIGDEAHMTGEGDVVRLYDDPNNNAIQAPNFDSQADEVNKQTHKEGEPNKVQDGNNVNRTELDNTPTDLGSVLVGHYYQELHGPTLINHRYAVRQTIHNNVTTEIYNYLNNKGIKLTNIVDRELGRILKEKPDIKIKFMKINPNSSNTTSNLNNIIFNVIEVTDEVRNIHDESNGQYIKGQDGKEYLIIGTLHNQLNNEVQKKSFDAMSADITNRLASTTLNDNEFYVDEKYSTTISKMYEGTAVKRIPGDTDTAVRSITELINSPERNPYGITLEDLKWEIVTLDGERSKLINPGIGNTFHAIKDKAKNLGNVFFFIPTSNGNYTPVRIRATTLNEIKEGSLKTRIDEALIKLTSLDYNDRVEAAKVLDEVIFYNTDLESRRDKNSKQGKMLWIGSKDSDIIELKDGDNLRYSFNLRDPNFSKDAFIAAVYEHNPRMQISINTLSNVLSLQEFAEAGCLDTDIASLTTYGANYQVGSMDSTGTQVISNKPLERAVESTSYWNGKTFRYWDGVWHDELDNPIDSGDRNLLFQIESNYRISLREKGSDFESGGKEYFIMNSDLENPEVLIRDKNSYSVTKYSRDKAIEFIQKLEAKKAEEARLEAALQDAPEVDLSDDINSDTGHVETESKSSSSEPQEVKPTITITPSVGTGNFSLSDLWPGGQYESHIDELFEMFDTGKFAGQIQSLEFKDIKNFLESKGILTEGIEDIDAWMQNLRDCK